MINVTAAIIRDGGKVLICQRPKSKSCELLWEFPGGKIEAGETDEQCLIRECQEELGITIKVLSLFSEVTFDYPQRTVHINFYICEIVDGTLQKKEHNDIRWTSPDQFDKFDFCPADNEVISIIKNEMFNQKD
jgi:8-oxo-dGTP diphosphatase